MPTESRDVVEEARELLARLPKKAYNLIEHDTIFNFYLAAPELLRLLADECERRDKLIVHVHVHSGYPKNGYMQMTTEQKALYDEIWERSVKALDAEEANHD